MSAGEAASVGVVPAPRAGADDAVAVREATGHAAVPVAEAATGRGPAADVVSTARPPAEDDWQRAAETIRQARRILLVCHVNPDGDALGSMLGFGLGLLRLGIPAQASFPEPFKLQESFTSMPGLDMLVPAGRIDPDPDLVISFDAASPERLGELADVLFAAPASIVIDHHVTNPGFGTIPLVDPTAAATAVVADPLMVRLGVPLDAAIAECLYVALSTDTGSFKYAGTTPAVHEFAARLLATGIKQDEISRRLFDTRPFGALRLLGDALGRAVIEPESVGGRGFVWTYATQADLARYRQRPSVLETLIDVVRSAEEAEVACVAKEVGAGEWSISLRSKGAVDVGQVAVALGGGGHPYAAGFTGHGDLAALITAIRDQL